MVAAAAVVVAAVAVLQTRVMTKNDHFAIDPFQLFIVLLLVGHYRAVAGWSTTTILQTTTATTTATGATTNQDPFQLTGKNLCRSAAAGWPSFPC